MVWMISQLLNHFFLKRDKDISCLRRVNMLWVESLNAWKYARWSLKQGHYCSCAEQVSFPCEPRWMWQDVMIAKQRMRFHRSWMGYLRRSTRQERTSKRPPTL